MGKSMLLLLCVVLGVLQQAWSYQARRSVKDYGAVGDGVTDDTDAIIRAMTEDRSDVQGMIYGAGAVYSSSTLTPAQIFFPGGTYKITKTIPIIYLSQMVGDADDVPVLKMVSEIPIRMIDAMDQQWSGNLVNQNNFYRQIRNFVLDMSECDQCTGVHWQVAQATQISNVLFKMNENSLSQGIWMENGSGGFISDLVFEGGMYGMWVGNQQFTSRNITIRGASIAGLYLNWDWGWTFKDLLIENSPVGIDIGSEMGSMTLLDCTIRNVSIAGIRTQYDEVTATKQYNDLIIDNLVFDATVSGSSNTVVLNAFDKVSLTVTEGKQEKVISWVQGMVWDGEKGTITAVDLAKEGKAPKKSSSLLVGGRGDDAESMFSMPRPAFDSATYAKLNAVTDLGVINDGETDTTEKLQQAILAAAKQSKVLYLPYGTYLITDTLYIPTGTRVLGEAWSIIMVGGDSVFQDQTKPVPAIQVGESSGEVGLVQLVDLLITTKGPQPGAILMQWNVRAPTTDRGATGMWEVHFRIGGAIGTSIDPQHCPRGDGAAAPASACTGAWAMFHVTDKGNGILENVWLWSADHDLDYDDQINVYNYRGMLIESTGPMWLYGTAAEHSILYQYNLNKASDIFMGMIQTETPYYQPSTLTPFTAEEVARVDSDPTFCTNDLRCSMALAVNVANSNNIYLYGAGLYSFFSQWTQGCLSSGSPNCQLELNRIDENSSVNFFAFNTYGSEYMLTQQETYSRGADNTNTFCSTAIADLIHM